MTVNFVQLSEEDEDEDFSVPILSALEQIKNFQVDIILLYIETQKIELMLQQVVVIFISLIEGVLVTPLNSQIQNQRATEGLCATSIKGTKSVYNFPAQ